MQINLVPSKKDWKTFQPMSGLFLVFWEFGLTVLVVSYSITEFGKGKNILKFNINPTLDILIQDMKSFTLDGDQELLVVLTPSLSNL